MDGYATHLPLLVRFLLLTQEHYPNQPVLEMGCGDYSTRLIKEVCQQQRRPFFVLYQCEDWGNKYKSFENDLICLEHVPDWKDSSLQKVDKWSLVLLDNEELVRDRVKHLKRLASMAECVLLHDSNRAIGLPEMAATGFEFHVTYPDLIPATTAFMHSEEMFQESILFES